MSSLYYPNSFVGPIPVSPARPDAAILVSSSKTPGQIPQSTENNGITWVSVPVLKGVSYGEVDNGDSVASVSINWPLGARQSITMKTSSTFSFIAPAPGITVQLKITQATTGGHVITWPAGIKWAGGSAVLSTASGLTDFATFYFDGTTYWGVLSKGFA